MLKPNAKQVVIQSTCCACENHVNIENSDACREQQGKAQSFFSLIHCLGALLCMFSNRGSGVTCGGDADHWAPLSHRSAAQLAEIMSAALRHPRGVQ